MHHATTVVHCELDYEGDDHSFTIKNSGGDKHTFIDLKKSELDLYFKLHSEVKSMKDFLKFDECDATPENQELILAKVAAYADKTDGAREVKKRKDVKRNDDQFADCHLRTLLNKKQNIGSRAVKWARLKIWWFSFVGSNPIQCKQIHTRLAQSVERQTFNLVVEGSNPSSGVLWRSN